MRVFTFKDRFAELVREGKKRQTVRPERKFPPKLKEEVSLRRWTGVPMRSKQEELNTGIIQIVAETHITMGDLVVSGQRMNAKAMDTFAQCDGFEDWPDLIGWFNETHGKWKGEELIKTPFPFVGQLFIWLPTQGTAGV